MIGKNGTKALPMPARSLTLPNRDASLFVKKLINMAVLLHWEIQLQCW